MFRSLYGLTRNPFAKDLPVDQLFETADHKQFAARMKYLETVKGFAVAYGRPGMGKTTAIRAYLAKLNPQLFKTVYLCLSTVTVSEFYRNICFGLGLIPQHKKVDMFRQIQEHVANLSYQKSQTTLFVLDEAHFLSGSILNELRMIFNFQLDSKNHAIVLLCGQTMLLNQLNLHIHEPLRQRIVVHHEFKGLAKEEAADFVLEMLRRAGRSEPLFTPDALNALADAAQGNPRNTASIAEKALLIGAQRNCQSIDSEIVAAAYEMLQIFASGGIA